MANGIEDTRHIKNQAQYHCHHILQVIHKHAKMQHNIAAPESQQNQDQHNRKEIQNFPGNRHLVNHHHDQNQGKRNHHLKAIDQHLLDYQKKFGNVDLRHNLPVIFHHFHTAQHTLVEKVPASQTDKHENQNKNQFVINVEEDYIKEMMTMLLPLKIDIKYMKKKLNLYLTIIRKKVYYM